MYNIIFEANSDRQNVFNDANPIICMMIHHFKKRILIAHIFYKDIDHTISELLEEYGTEPDHHFHQIPNMNKTKFAELAYVEIMKYSDLVETMEAEYEEFDPVMLSGSYYSTDAIVATMNNLFKQKKKELEAKDKLFEVTTLFNRGILNQVHCDRIIDMNFKTASSDNFESNILGSAYKKALISTPGIK